MQNVLVIATLLLTLAITFNHGLDCYVCNSLQNADCAGKDLMKFKQTCANSTINPYCRKIDQTINGQKSVVRTCGSKQGSAACYSTTGSNTVNVCSCNSALCNDAVRRQFTILPLSFLFLFVLIQKSKFV